MATMGTGAARRAGALLAAAAVALASCTVAGGDGAAQPAPSAAEPTPSAVASADDQPFPGFAPADQELIGALASFEPSPATLDVARLTFQPAPGAEVLRAADAVAAEPTVVDPAPCGPILDLLNLATDDDRTARADDPILELGLLVESAREHQPATAGIRVRVLDEPGAATAMVTLPSGAADCAEFTERYTSAGTFITVDGVEAATVNLDGLAEPVTRLTVHIVGLVDESTGNVDLEDIVETTYYAAVGRVVARVRVDDALPQDQVAGAVLADLGTAVAEADA